MPKLLLLETSGDICSVAIAVDGRVVALKEAPDCRNHAAVLTLFIQECAQQAGMALSELDAIAVSSGPGAYTSLRVGASVAKGLCYALDKPLIAVDTLLALADASRKAYTDDAAFWLAPSLDARREEVWTAVYNQDLQLLAPAQPLVLENNSFENHLQKVAAGGPVLCTVIAGSGMEKIRSGEFQNKVVFLSRVNCSATHLIDLAERYFQSADFQDVAYFEPFYMKPPNITTPNPPSF